MWGKIKKKIRITIIKFFLIILIVIVLLPLVLTLAYSFEGKKEIEWYFNKYLDEDRPESIRTKTIPIKPNLLQYKEVLLTNPAYIKYFFNSVRYASLIIIGQLLTAPFAAYAFAKFKFRFKNTLFFLYIVLVLLPFQAVMVPNYIMLNNMGLINTSLSLILPSIFSPFSVFLLRQYIINIDDNILNAARVEGANEMQVFLHLVIPIVKPGIIAMIILSFAEVWNMVEQPLLFIQNKQLYPMSLILNDLERVSVTEVFAGVIIFIIPVMLFYLIFHNDIIEGIESIWGA